jgi:hypothetical protein
MIGRDEADSVWEDHIEYCIGCEICEIAVRLWNDEALELRSHPKCLNEIIVTKNGI